MTRDDIAAAFARRDRAWQQRDASALAADFADHAVVESPMQGRLEGRARVREVFEQWLTAFPDLSFVPDELIVEGDRGVQFFTITGTQMGPFGALPATGRRFTITGALVTTFGDDGRIVHERRVYDVTNMLVQLGALRTKPMEEAAAERPRPTASPGSLSE